MTFVIFFQATEHGIDVSFVESLMPFVDGHLSAEFF
jgi:hypothetical protein